jgi:hypothetical protein
MKIVLLGLLEDAPCKKEVTVLAQHNCSTQWARCPAVVKYDMTHYYYVASMVG